MTLAGIVVHADILSDPTGRSKGCGIVEFASPEGAQNAVATLNEVQVRGRKIYLREDREESRQSIPVTSSIPNYHMPSHPSYPMMPPSYHPQYDPPMQYAHPAMMNPHPHHPPSYHHPPPHHNHLPYPSAASGPPDGGGDSIRHIGRRLYVGNIPYDLSWQDLKDHFRAVVPVLHVEIPTNKDGKSKGYGIVELSSSNDAITAIGRLNNSTLKGRAIFVREDRDEGK